jgi:hypothetical protein
MGIQIEEMIAQNEVWISDPIVRKSLEELVCGLIRIGCKIPTSDDVLILCRNMDIKEELLVNYSQQMVLHLIGTGLMYLHQLALIKERK